MKIAQALLLGTLFVLLLPRALRMVKETPAAKPGDWTGALLPLICVVLFVLLLMRWMN
jgi:hypothetical protein